MRFDGKSVIVTGAAQGIGRAIAARFASEGANVLVADLQVEKGRQTASSLSAQYPGEVRAIAVDVTKLADMERMVAAAVEWQGHVDCAINNAGTVTMARLADLEESAFEAVMAVNVRGVFLAMKAVLPHMLDRGTGVIVNVASQAGKKGYKLLSHYCASKAAVLLMTQSVALEVAPTVRVNCVCPGMVKTAMTEYEYQVEQEMTGETPKAIEERWMSSIPMERYQETNDIAGVVAFLCSADASEMTGQGINVTGGMLMSP